MLIGLASKNAILIVEFAKVRRDAGAPAAEAAVTAARLRFRAVMMTALSFILGVLPLVFASGAGAASRTSIGFVVLSGMVTATVVGVVFVPVLYWAVERVSESGGLGICRRRRAIPPDDGLATADVGECGGRFTLLREIYADWDLKAVSCYHAAERLMRSAIASAPHGCETSVADVDTVGSSQC